MRTQFAFLCDRLLSSITAKIDAQVILYVCIFDETAMEAHCDYVFFLVKMGARSSGVYVSVAGAVAECGT